MLTAFESLVFYQHVYGCSHTLMITRWLSDDPEEQPTKKLECSTVPKGNASRKN